jgi:hypothetical protein
MLGITKSIRTRAHTVAPSDGIFNFERHPRRPWVRDGFPSNRHTYTMQIVDKISEQRNLQVNISSSVKYVLFQKTHLLGHKINIYVTDAFERNKLIHRKRWSYTVRKRQNTMIRQSGREPSARKLRQNVVDTCARNRP